MYELSELQARLIAMDYSYLVGRPIRPGSEFIIEEVQPIDYGSYWSIVLKSSLENNDELLSIFWAYISETKEPFTPGKYGLFPPI